MLSDTSKGADGFPKAPQTIEQSLARAIDCFLSFESKQDAKLDARVLMAHVVDKPLSYLLAWSDTMLTTSQYQQFIKSVERRRAGEPVAFITGKREFWSLELFVDPCTLIPRPDTEILVEQVLNQNPEPNTRLLDLGTGTGAIALALAFENPTWSVEAVDFNKDAVALAQKNAEHHGIKNVRIYQSDWFSSIPQQPLFDLIVSNPPYIDVNDQHLSHGDVRFEPSSALVASEQGFADIIHIINTSKRYLKSGGQLYLEHGFEQHLHVQALLAQAGYIQIESFIDYGNNPRITMGYLP
ncbi:peptide chain release factor N(5)-glutamine methyltransferase [Thalassotalea aquiviva]|uniref:peptide chain release factor N(5)-glutamine methyltransferase n=1 Tax=Thalassotalea aquiviva TaxID=3242415 RepID=UPI003529DE4E